MKGSFERLVENRKTPGPIATDGSRCIEPGCIVEMQEVLQWCNHHQRT